MTEVDDAVEKANDPTGGRGVKGGNRGKLEATNEDEQEVLKSAV